MPVLLTTGVADARTETCALLDSGSTRSFCARRIADRLGVQERREAIVLSTLLQQEVRTTASVELMVTGLFGRRPASVRLTGVLVVDSFPDGLTEAKADPAMTALWTHLKDLAPINKRAEHLSVELLIGQDAPSALTPLEVRRGRDGEPFAVRTKLGWAINGPLQPTRQTTMSFNAFVEETTKIPDPHSERAMRYFWEVDDPEDPEQLGRSVEDQRVLELWDKEGVQVMGHYQYPIPFRDDEPALPDNLPMAARRLDGLCARLRRNKSLRSRYVEEMESLIAKGYAERVPGQKGPIGRTWYLPHHPVLSPNKPEKTRIVFDCAAVFKGVALNMQVMQGPDMMNDLQGILLRFREGKVALSADIEAMFHQVLVTPKDRDALRFLWWPQGDVNRPPVQYRMTRHLFGGVWSPACAAFALRQTLKEGGRTSNELGRSFYVDDLLLSVDSEGEAMRCVQKLRETLRRGGFRLTKWMSNSTEVLATIPQHDRSSRVKDIDLAKDELPEDRALGVLWNLEDDSLRVAVTAPNKPFTKRGVLSAMSSVFDPLGFLVPFTIRAKMIFQDEVRRKEGWDVRLTKTAEDRWVLWLAELQSMVSFRVHRYLLPPRFGRLVGAQLHHFCDASTKAYAAVTYVRLQDDLGYVHCGFIMARSRLAPIKTTSIPRLELCAAVLATSSDVKLRRELTLPIESSTFWSDSMIVLQYIASPSRRFHTFVANRLGTIHRLTSPPQWRHVASEENPADDATRGLPARTLLAGGRWRDGPAFLCLPIDNWPPLPGGPAVDLDGDPEVKKEVSALAIEAQEPNTIDQLLSRYSSWYILQRAVAWIRRFATWITEGRPSGSGSRLATVELQAARTAILRYVQGTHYRDDIADLRRGKLTKKSNLYRLEPILDVQGLLRVGGRRLDTSEGTARSNPPILLPKSHHVTALIVRDVHVFLARHSGREHTLACLRGQYWVVAGRPLIDRLLRDCFICRRVNSKPLVQRQGELPVERISADNPPFTHTGVDCFGPFSVTCMRRSVKRFGCIFTCLSSRAAHLEVLESLDADAFLNALTRFIARRGPPAKLFSDMGTNFQRADKDLRAAAKGWRDQANVEAALHRRAIEWVFQPPMASHMGGVWERQIRSVRKIMSSIIGSQRIDDARLHTLFCEVEATLNGRPITAAPGDASDPEALTPDHLLRVGAGLHLPLEDHSLGDTFRRRWTHAQALADRFWRRWRAEYLHTLRMRQRRIAPTRNLCVGDLVLIADPPLPRNQWRLGRVLQVFPGSDGLVRKVRLRTSSGPLVRPIVKLCLLEGDVAPSPPSSSISLQ